MKFKIILFALLAFIYTGCSHKHESNPHGHENETPETESHDHEQAVAVESDHAHEDVKISITAYSNEFELFAEADPFVVGHKSNVLSHFSNLPDFTALENGSMTIRLIVNGKETNQTLEKPSRKGIYSFDIVPGEEGKGELKFDIKTEKGEYQVIATEIEVFLDEHDAIHEAEEEAVVTEGNATFFSKEQSWKINFATELPKNEPFGQVIKTTAQVQTAPGNEYLVSAKTNGIVLLSTENVLEGKSVSSGQVLFTISGSELADNNSSVRFAETKNNFEKAKADYERVQELAKDKIVSEKDLLNAKNQYDNAKVVYDNLNKNFNSSGQNVTSPMNGFVKQLFVQNGQYVEAGQPIVTIAQNETLLLRAEVRQKYAAILDAINSANIRTLYNNQSYSLEQLNGKILSVGKSTNSDNYLIPVSLQIENKGGFVSGGFVELYLKTLTNTQALTIPNTALLEQQGVFFVFVQITPELFEKREVKTGATDGLRTEIIKGITLEKRVVSVGAILIKLAQATGTLDPHSGHVH